MGLPKGSVADDSFIRHFQDTARWPSALAGRARKLSHGYETYSENHPVVSRPVHDPQSNYGGQSSARVDIRLGLFSCQPLLVARTTELKQPNFARNLHEINAHTEVFTVSSGFLRALE